MSLQRGVQVNISDYLSIDNYECLAIEQGARVADASARAQDFRLLNIMQLDAKLAAVAKRPAHRLRTMMKVDDYLIATVTREVFSNVTDEWLTQNGDGRFGAVFRQGPQPRAVASGKNHCAHAGIVFAREG